MLLHIKNMVCDRCLRSVRRVLDDAGLTVDSVELGRAEVRTWPDAISREAVQQALQAEGFALLDDPKATLTEQLKVLLINDVHHAHERPAHQNVSDFLSQKLGYDYTYLSQLFSTQTGQTIERFLISQRIERAKALLQEGEWTIADIAYQLGYSSVPHFTNQFRKEVGKTPAQFRKEPTGRRTLDAV
ncbi:helix-turn-helix domain-containing protein [Fibrella sp. WM1]|uniref:helix-turn-helix domain-containing protein n=1 Tax=Fibrella musci TaxID=3242485 RepID=UPI003520A5CD